MSPTPTPDQGAPFLRIVRGDPDAAQLAALVLVLAAAGGGAEPEAATGAPVSQWGAPARLVREPVSMSGWWESALPR